MICAWCGGAANDEDVCDVCGRAPMLHDRYALEAQLGRRGASTTYRAHDRETDGMVVVKELLLRGVSDAKELELFQREADLLERVDHPGVPKFLDHFEWERGKQIGLYIVQEHIDGESLERQLEHWRPSEQEVARTMADVLPMLAALRELNIVHRDIKPANLLRTEDGIALVDFGAGRAVAESIYRAGSTVTGTFGYMAPEQMLAQAVPASDIYGLGATAVRLLTGKDPSELIAEHGSLQWRTAAPGVSAELAGLVDTMLHPDASQRPDDVEQLAADLRAFADGDASALSRFRAHTALVAASSTDVVRVSAGEAATGIIGFTKFGVAFTLASAAITVLGLVTAKAFGDVVIFLFAGMLVVVSLAFTAHRFRRVARHYRIARKGTAVPAAVARRFIRGDDFLVEIEHRVGDDVHSTIQPVSEARFLNLDEGDEVTAFCDPRRPDTVVLADAGVPALLPKRDPQ